MGLACHPERHHVLPSHLGECRSHPVFSRSVLWLVSEAVVNREVRGLVIFFLFLAHVLLFVHSHVVDESLPPPGLMDSYRLSGLVFLHDGQVGLPESAPCCVIVHDAEGSLHISSVVEGASQEHLVALSVDVTELDWRVLNMG